MRRNSKFAISWLTAGLAGYLAGILTAPKSGKQTRKDIKNTAEKNLHDAELQLKKLHTDLSSALDKARVQADKATGKAKNELEAAIDTGKQVKEKAREVLSAIHEGDSEDEDLKAAITDAQKSLDSLKAYIKVDKNKHRPKS